MLVISQTDSVQVNTTLQDLQAAEGAGATPSEMQGLINQMNLVASLEIQLQNLPPQDNTARIQLSNEINATLASVDARAVQLKTVASQRTLVDRVVTYSTGLVAAIIGTAVYYFGVQLYTIYRIKRTLRMTIIPR